MDEYFEDTFARAAARGNIRIMKQMLKKGVDVNRWGSHAKTPLMIAIENGRDEAVCLLIEAGANVNRCNSDGKRPLTLALNGHDNSIPVATETETHVTRQDSARTVEICPYKIVSLLIQAGADVNGWSCDYRINDYITPLGYAVSYNCVQCMSLLIEAGADVKTRDVQDHLLRLASHEGHYQCLNLLIQLMGDDIKRHMNPLSLAAERGHVKCVELLINAGIDIDGSCAFSFNKTLLMIAVMNDHTGCASLLIKAGADVNAYNSPYYVLSYARSLAATRLLLRSGAEINRSFTRFPKEKRAKELLLAAGETRFTFSYSLAKADDLMGMCREAIRKHLLNLDEHTNLFGRVEKLGLPAALVRYLMFDQSLDDGREARPSCCSDQILSV